MNNVNIAAVPHPSLDPAVQVFHALRRDVKKYIEPHDAISAKKYVAFARMIIQVRIQISAWCQPSWEFTTKPKLLSILAELNAFVNHLSVQYSNCAQAVLAVGEIVPTLQGLDEKDLLATVKKWDLVMR